MKPRKHPAVRHVLACVLAAATWLASSHAAAAPVIRTSDQGMHRIAVPGGQLIAIKGTYQDILKYKRSLTLYFQATNDGDWDHVPIVDGKDDSTIQWFHVSHGEDTLADAVIVRGTRGVFLITAEKVPEKPAFKLARYAFGKASDDTDGPAYVFMRQSVKTVAGRAAESVESLLDKEAASIK